MLFKKIQEQKIFRNFFEENGYDFNEIFYVDSPNHEFLWTDVEFNGKNYPKIRVDGYVPLEIRRKKEPEAEKPLAIEFHGCAWHGCEKCFHDDHVICGKTTALRRFESELRVKAIENLGVEVKIFWEHDILRQLDEDIDMKIRFEKMIDLSPINPRDAFFGGKNFLKVKKL